MKKELHIISSHLRSVIEDLEDLKDIRLKQIIYNLKQEEDDLDTLIMNIEDEE